MVREATGLTIKTRKYCDGPADLEFKSTMDLKKAWNHIIRLGLAIRRIPRMEDLSHGLSWTVVQQGRWCGDTAVKTEEVKGEDGAVDSGQHD